MWGPSLPGGPVTKALAGTLIQGLSSSLCCREAEVAQAPPGGLSNTMEKASLRPRVAGAQLEWTLGW